MSHYERIRLALEQVRGELESFVKEKLSAAYGEDYNKHYAVPDWTEGQFNTDVQVLCNTIVNNWDEVFSKCMRKEAKHLVHQVRKTRNRFAHQESFDLSDTYSALHEAQRLLEEIKSDPAPIVESKRLLVEEMARAGESAEDIAREAEQAAEEALAKSATDEVVHVRLTMLRNGQATSVEFLVAPPFAVGRADAAVGPIDVDLTELEEAAYVSRQHARFLIENGSVVVEDLGSSNGTYIKRDDYEKIDRAEITDGDEIVFGNAKFVCRIER